MHLLRMLGVKTAEGPLTSIGISVEGKRYFYDGQLRYSPKGTSRRRSEAV